MTRPKLFPLLFVLLIITPILSFSQSTKRIEIELLENSDHHIIPLKENGLLVLYKTEAKKNANEIMFDLYDTDLSKINSTSTPLADKDAVLIDYVVSDEDIYILYSESKSTAIFTYMKDLEIINYNVKTRTLRKFSGSLEKYLYYEKMFVNKGVVSLVGSMGLSPMQIQRKSCMFAALSCGCMILAPFYANNMFKKIVPTVNKFDFNKSKVTVSSYTYLKEKEKSELLTASINDSTGDINLISKTIISKKENKHTLHTLKGNKFSKEVNIKFPNGKEIIEARVSTFEDRIVYGATYSPKITKMNFVAISAGVAVGSIKNGVSEFNTLIPYSKFKNFKFQLSTVEKRMVKKNKKKGKEETGIEMMIKFHNTIEQEDKFVFMGEVYYPTYRYETTTTYVNGRAQTTTRKVFDGFKYQGALVFAVSKKGEFLWENGVNVEDYNKYWSDNSYRYKFIEQNDGGIKILYNDGKTLFTSTVFDEKTLINGKSVTFLEQKVGDKKTKVTANNKTDKASSVSSNGVDYWYDNYFISYGDQTITSKKEGTLLGLAKNKKKVYFINKIDVE